MTSTSAVADAQAALEQLAACPVWQLSDAELAAMVAGLQAVARLADAQTVRALGEVDHRGLAATSGAGSPAAWVRQVVPSTSQRDASRLARLAGRLYRAPRGDQLPATREAVEAGRLGLG